MAPAVGIADDIACIADRKPFEHAIFCSFDKASNFFVMSSGLPVLKSDAREHVVDVGVNIDVPPVGMCMPPVAPPVVGIDPPAGEEPPFEMAERPVPTSDAFEEQAGWLCSTIWKFFWSIILMIASDT